MSLSAGTDLPRILNFSRCIDLCFGVPFMCLNLVTLPNLLVLLLAREEEPPCSSCCRGIRNGSFLTRFIFGLSLFKLSASSSNCLAIIIFMLFTQQQPLAVNLKSSFVNIIFLHFIKISNNGFRKKPYLLLHKNPRDDAGSFAHLILASWRWSSYTVSFWISHLCSMIVTRTGALGMVVEQEGLRSIWRASFEPLSH